MKKLLTIAALAFLFVSVSTVEAQDLDIELAPRIGYDLGDLNELFIGAEGRFYVEDFAVVLSSGFDFYFASSGVDRVNVFGIDLNALYEFELEDGAITSYAGAGIGIIRQSVSIDGGDGGFGLSGSTTETGINLLGGIFNIDALVRPFAQAKTNLGSNFTLFSLMGGVLIDL